MESQSHDELVISHSRLDTHLCNKHSLLVATPRGGRRILDMKGEDRGLSKTTP